METGISLLLRTFSKRVWSESASGGNGSLGAYDRPFICPECNAVYDTPESLSPHIERHREVTFAQYSRRGKPITEECPKGCGRHFLRSRFYGHACKGTVPSRSVLMAEHIPICDGSEPIILFIRPI